MTIEKRTVVDEIITKRGGLTTVHRVKEYYDPSVVPQDEIEEVVEVVVIEAEVSEIIEDGPNAGKKAIIKPAVMGVNVITAYKAKITGIEDISPRHTTTYHKDDTLPDDVKAFLAEADS